MSTSTHPRVHLLERDGQDRNGKPRYRTQISNLSVGDRLAGFGRVLEWQEVEPENGWRMFRMVTEHPRTWPTRTNSFVMPAYVYYGVLELEGEGDPSK
ncbi:hypothetical protein [Streptomyces sp. 8N706]|uniref:hypothetical protein n=1 Tax=Streptomyces sp. 8N706 TaxID=3457416 RepID=UPI003FD45E2B